MKFDTKEIYQVMYGILKNDEHKVEFLAEQDVMYYYVAKTYDNYVMLNNEFKLNNIFSEHGASEFLLTKMRSIQDTVTVETFDKTMVSKGRRMFTNACGKIKYTRKLTQLEKVFMEYPTLNEVYVMKNADDTIKWIYVDKSIDTQSSLSISTFPDGYKSMLLDKLTVVNREECELC